MSDIFIRLGILLAIFATVFVVVQLSLQSAWSRSSHLNTVNKRMRMISQGRSREEIALVLRRNGEEDYSAFPAPIAAFLANFARSLRVIGIKFSVGQALFFMVLTFVILFALIGLAVAASGFAISAGVIVLIGTIAF